MTTMMTGVWVVEWPVMVEVDEQACRVVSCRMMQVGPS